MHKIHILGLHNSGWTTSAALFCNGNLIAACPEERLDRQKYSRLFPIRSIHYCLTEAGITLSDVDYVAVAWNAGVNVAARYRGAFSERLRFAGEWLYSVPNHILGRMLHTEVDNTEQIFTLPGGSQLNIQHVDHHNAHAAVAYYPSAFDHAAILTCDGYGEKTCTSWKSAIGNRLHTYQSISFPQSIGSFYSAITEFLGFQPDGDEWKVMGMSAYGDPKRFQKQFRLLYRLLEAGRYEFDLTYFNHFNFDSRNLYSDKIRDLFGSPRSPGEDIRQVHYDIAASAQSALEELIFHCLRFLYEKTRCPDLCLSGGTIMN